MPQSALTLIWLTVSLVVMSSGVEIISEWSQIPGQYKFKHVSIGQAGVWAIDEDDNIYYRSNTYHNELGKGDNWTLVDGRLKQLDAGKNVLWGTTVDDDILVRIGITQSKPTGCKWIQIEGKLKHVSVSDIGRVWGVNSQNLVYRRVGTNGPNPLGTSWENIGSPSLNVVTVGMSGVWGVDANDAIFYRTGTYGDPYAAGSGWQRVSGHLKYISSGNAVLGVNIHRLIYKLNGASGVNPFGTDWTQVNGSLTQLETWNAVTWGISNNNQMYTRIV